MLKVKAARHVGLGRSFTTRSVSFEVALFGFKAEGLTQPLPVSKAPEHENSEVLGPKGRHPTLML